MEQFAGFATEGDPDDAVLHAFGLHHVDALTHETVLMALRILDLDLQHHLAAEVLAGIEILFERRDLLTVLQFAFLQCLVVRLLYIDLSYVVIVMHDDDIVLRKVYVELRAVAAYLLSEFQ